MIEKNSSALKKTKLQIQRGRGVDGWVEGWKDGGWKLEARGWRLDVRS